MVIVWGNFHKWLIDFKTLWWRTGWTILLPPILNLNLTLFTVFPIQLALLSQRVSPRCNPKLFLRRTGIPSITVFHWFCSWNRILQSCNWSQNDQSVQFSWCPEVLKWRWSSFWEIYFIFCCLSPSLIVLRWNLVLFLNQNNSLVGCFTQSNLCPGRCSHLKRTVEKRTHLARSLSSP